MGDRTYARTTFREEFLPLIEAKNPRVIKDNEVEDEGDGLTSIIDYEANYGEIFELQDVLTNLSAPTITPGRGVGDMGLGPDIPGLIKTARSR